MAVNIELVAEKAHSLLAGSGYSILSLNAEGETVIDPTEASRFVIKQPNILVRLDQATETVSMAVREDFDNHDLREAVKHLANDYLMNFDFKIFGKVLKPKSETIDIAQKSEKQMGDVLEALTILKQLAGLPIVEAEKPTTSSIHSKTKDIKKHDPAHRHTHPEGGNPQVCPKCKGAGCDDCQDGEVISKLRNDPKVESTLNEFQQDLPGVWSAKHYEVYMYLRELERNNAQWLHQNYDNDGAMIPMIQQNVSGYASYEDAKMGLWSFRSDVRAGYDVFDEDINDLGNNMKITNEGSPFRWENYSEEEGYDENFQFWLSSTNDERHIERRHPGQAADPANQHLSDGDEAHKMFQRGLQDNGIDIISQQKISAKRDQIRKAKRDARNSADAQAFASRLNQFEAWEQIEEGFSSMSGSSKTSYQGLDNVKLIVRHKKEVNEEVRGSRSRNIHSIFIQRGDERFKMAETNLKAARAMARHVKNGGEPFDSVGSAINEMAIEQRKLREFVRYVKKSKLVNEENESYVSLAVENIDYITKAFTKLAGVKSYANATEQVLDRSQTEVLQDDIDLEGKFTETHFDNKVANVVDSIKTAMARRTSFESIINTAVTNETFDSLKSLLSEDDGMEFATPSAKLGHQVGQMSNSVSNSHLGNYLSGISKKLNNGDRMSQHEYTTIKSCLLGAHGQQHNVPVSVAESVEDQYEQFIEQFDIL